MTFKLTHLESTKPQVVRICYLDEGTREIILPPAVVLNPNARPSEEKKEAEPAEPQIVFISNLDDGNHAIVVDP